MPVVISLLNAFTGLAAAATGFELDNNVLIVSGALVGASGTLLTLLMGRAMNRTIANVIFGAFGQVVAGGAARRAPGDGRTVRRRPPEDVAIMLAYAQRVVIVPGYGLAVAQAQHDVRELADLLEERGVDVRYAIHPVAGRMPGHMNVLLAEANVPYTQLPRWSEINPEFPQTDVALVIGANDVTNPAARDTTRQPDLRDADPRRGPGRRPSSCSSASMSPGIRRDRQRALSRPEDVDALRRREGPPCSACRRGQGALGLVRCPVLQRRGTWRPRSRRSRAVRRGAGRFRRARARRMDDAAEGLRHELSGRRLPGDAGARRRARAPEVGDVVPGQPGARAADGERPRRALGRGDRRSSRRSSTPASVTALRTGAAAVLAAETLGRAEAQAPPSSARA